MTAENWRRRLIPGAVGAMVLAAALGTSLAREPAAGEPREPPVRRVRVAAVEKLQGEGLRFPGVVQARDRAELAFGSAGRLAARPVEVGDRVNAGALLARLEDDALSHQAAAATARRRELATRLEQAERDQTRAERLHEARAVTAEERERATSEREALAATLAAAATAEAEARRQLVESRLVAPWAGTVVEVRYRVGERLAAGDVAVVLAADGDREVRVEVPEGLVARLSPGEAAAVSLPLLGVRLPGRVRSVAAAAAGAGHLFPVLVTVEGGSALPSGATAEVAFTGRAGEALSVPLAAVTDPSGSRPAVLRVHDGTVERVAVRIGRLQGERIEVGGDLREGDEVVVAGLRGLSPGAAVEVLR
jgi:membrane fusion protein, multidrug efflux system